MAWSTKKKIVVWSSLGTLLTAVGGGMIPLMAWIIRTQVEKNVQIQEGNELYEVWRDVPIPVYMQFYMFNLINPSEVLKGEMPFVEQRGPYTYRENLEKTNITFNDNGTVTYRQPRIFTFEREMSVGNESDEFTSPNPIFWTVLQTIKWEPPWLQQAINILTSIAGEDMFFKKSMKDIVWGYEDALLSRLHSLDEEWFYTDIVGYFINKNNTDDGIYTVFTGETDIQKVGIIDKYNGSSYLDFWTTPWANMINGTDGTRGPPYLDKSSSAQLFSSDICRSVSGQFFSDVSSPQGIDLWRYTAPSSALENATINPDNAGFCTPQNSCLPTGLLNVSACQLVDFTHIPIAISFPHFYLAESSVVESVGGMHPNADEHQTVADVEPYTGLVLQAAKRLQINIRIQSDDSIPSTAKLRDLYLPVFWINESAVVDDKNAERLKSMLFTPLLVVHALEYLLLSVGGTIVLMTVLFGLYKRKKNNYLFYVTTEEEDMINQSTHDTTRILPRQGIYEADKDDSNINTANYSNTGRVSY